jgi:hypothetical protein
VESGLDDVVDGIRGQQLVEDGESEAPPFEVWTPNGAASPRRRIGRLQARAAGGASSCKPWLRGTRPRPGVIWNACTRPTADIRVTCHSRKLTCQTVHDTIGTPSRACCGSVTGFTRSPCRRESESIPER